MKIIKILLIAAVMVLVPMVVPTIASAETAKESICKGAGLAGGGTSDCSNPAGSPSVEGVIGTAINLISLIVGVIAVIMIIIGGLKYIMSSGDSNNINSAKNTILYAIIGLVIVAFAQVIVKFVLHKV